MCTSCPVGTTTTPRRQDVGRRRQRARGWRDPAHSSARGAARRVMMLNAETGQMQAPLLTCHRLQMIIQRDPVPRARSPPSRRRTPTTPRRRKRSRSPERRKSPHSATKQSEQHRTPPRTDRKPLTDGRRSAPRSDRLENGRHTGRRPLREDSPPGSESRQPRRRSPSPVRRQRSEPRSIANSLAADIQRLTNDTGVPQAMKCAPEYSGRPPVCMQHAYQTAV